MPFPVVAAIGAGASLLGNLFSAGSQSAANKANREFQIGMYNRQRQDALSDWDRQNAYNSPQAQMQRFKDAGLNPNLIYGQTTTAQPVRSSSPGNYKQEPVSLDLGGVLSQFVSTMLAEKQLDLLKEKVYLTNQQSALTNQKYATEVGKSELQGVQQDLAEDRRDYLRAIYPSDIEKHKSDAVIAAESAASLPDMNKANLALKDAQVRNIADQIATREIQRREAESRMETDSKRRDQIDEQIKNLKQAREYIRQNTRVREKDADYYEGKLIGGVIKDIVGKALGKKVTNVYK